MKGYSISDGFMGYVDGGYMLFACESEYIDYIEEEDEESSLN
ncbi:hypothetical protein [Bilifractor sp. HCP3S3_D3]|nr:hypothetical protein [Bilifractor sp.]